MFHFDRGLFLTQPALALDVQRRQACGFISHAHGDHMAPHELILCTPQTGRLLRQRISVKMVRELSYGVPVEWNGAELTAVPAGHVLGSAMLHVKRGELSLLYTGDFKLVPSATAQAAQPLPADVLIMETTFGHPRYRLPPRKETAGRLIELVQKTLHSGATPVIHAYALGKAQEVTRILTSAGIPVQQHPQVYAISRVYEECGCPLGDVKKFSGRPITGHAVVAPPRWHKSTPMEGIVRVVRFAVSGWANDPTAAQRMGVDHALPLSDHADYDELWQLIEQVQPREIFCTHGPEEFVDRLRRSGLNAHVLGKPHRKLEPILPGF